MRPEFIADEERGHDPPDTFFASMRADRRARFLPQDWVVVLAAESDPAGVDAIEVTHGDV